jgi:hypothetical protein
MDPHILDHGTTRWMQVVSLTPRDTHCVGGWMGPRTGVDDVERITIVPLPGLEL